MTHLSFCARLSTVMIHERKKKLSRGGGDLHEEEKREREREREAESRESAVLLLASIYGLFIYVPLSGFLPPTPAEDSHRMREMYLMSGSALAHYFHVMQGAILGKQADICFPPLFCLTESVDLFAL